MSAVQSAWHDPAIAAKYQNGENATRPYAKLLVARSGLATAKEAYILDLACGTGAAVQEIYNAVPQENWGGIKVYGGDISAGMLAYLKNRGEENGWKGLETGVVDGNKMHFANDTFTHAISTFSVFAMPNALKELFRVTKPRGWVGVAVWRKLGWMSLVHRSIAQMSPPPYAPSEREITAKLFDNKPWDDEAYVLDQLRSTGFVDVQSEVMGMTAGVGSAEAALDSMQMPLNSIKTFWPEDTRDDLVKEINSIMLKELENMVVDGAVQMEFDALCAWGYKP